MDVGGNWEGKIGGVKEKGRILKAIVSNLRLDTVKLWSDIF